MITALEFIQGGLKQLHGNLDKQLDNITADQLHAVPSGNAKANTIAWGLWHYLRTEDNVVQYILQNKKTPIWVEGATRPRRGATETAQGTGRSTADAQALRIKDVGAFGLHGQGVASTDALHRQERPPLLDRMVTVRPPLARCTPCARRHGLRPTHGMTTSARESELARTLGCRPHRLA
jgi:hypothetical protein